MTDAGQPLRLATGGLIDRNRPVGFSFDGRQLEGYAGDTLASALLANGVQLVGRSFKYHRPRGIATAGPEEPNALVELGSGARREPNTKATTVELYDGLAAASQNRWPSLSLDVLSLAGLAAPFLTAGFYYKTFMWPPSFWERVYEPAIRRAAGLGRASGLPDPDRYEKSHAFCDVLVVGSGPAGLMAALSAAEAGARVILCEEDFRLGGRLLSERHEIDGAPGAEWAAACAERLAGMDRVTLMTRTSVFAAYDGSTYAALERVSDHLAEAEPFAPRQRLWKIVAGQCVVAAGAYERPIAFGGNDRPGVMQAAAVRTYINRFGVAPAARVSVFTCTDAGWCAAAELIAAGVPLDAVIDPRDEAPEAFRAAVEWGGAEIHLGAQVIGVRGGKQVKDIEVCLDGHTSARIRTGALAVSGGFNPAIGLTTHRGCRPRWSSELAAFVPGELPTGIVAAGAAAGRFTLAQALADGATAGAQAAKQAGFGAQIPTVPACSEEGFGIQPLWRTRRVRGVAFVDLQNDVTEKDIALAEKEGFRSLEHLKRYTTLGMATDQGKTGAVVGQAIMAELTGRDLGETGAPIARPPAVPVAIAAFAGPHRGANFRPYRRTASHGWAERQGAVFTETGQWLRAQWFPRDGERDWLESVAREASNVRTNVGVTDVSTLGKIDIQGADAGEFLDRVYINTFSTLPVGRARYGVMLREDGFVLDDGTTSRLGPTHFLMTTTTLNAARVMQHLEFCHQVLWPDLDVQMVSVSEQWSQYAIAGPRSRELIARLVDQGFEVSNEAFPYMAAAEVTVCGGAPARLFRVSFSGELAYELAVPARYGEALIEAVVTAGEPFGIMPYGSEALGILRIEKGHAAGSELNGQTTAADLGLGRMLSTKKDCIGRVMASRPGLVDPSRPALVGLKPVEEGRRLRAGAHVFGLGAAAVPESDEGHVTSAAWSPALGHWIALALVCRGPSRVGKVVRAYDPVRGEDIQVELCHPVFVDPAGERLRG